MENVDKCHSIHLIDGNGKFNVAGIENFAKKVGMSKWGVSYAVVSIMGPQSSGKSTLLNHLFRTNFCEMDAFKGRSQTTKGIWMAKCDGIEPSTLVMDVEGTDGGERGEDDTAFEKRSTLFALYVSDILLINMWYNDIGREQAANKPLLRIVFQVVMRLFTDFSSRKRTLIFVIRDMIMVTPLEILKSQLMNDMQKIWDSVPKSEDSKNTPLSEFFNVEVVALSHYVLMKEQFKKEVTSLRQRFFHSIESGGLAGDRQDVLSASGFSLNVEMIWEKIKENKDLNLPAHKLMVATVRCEQIADETFSCFVADKDWCNLKKAVQSRPILRFGKKLSLLLDTYLSEYDAEALYFDEEIRSKKREVLKRNLLQHVQASYHSMLTHIRSRSLCKFKEIFAKTLDGGEGFYMAARGCTKSSMSLFDEGCADAVIKLANWDISESRNKLLHDIDAHVASVCAAKLSELTALYEAKLNEAISEPFKDLLDRAGNDTWQEIRKLLQRESESAVSRLSGELSGFEMDKQTSSTLLVNLKDYARRAVEAKAREEAGRVQIHMKDRFVKSFGFDSDSVQRVWTGMEDIRAIATYARLSPLKLLSVMAAIRLDGDVDNIENTLSLALLDSTNHAVPSSRITSVDPMASRTWEEVLPSNTLITPIRCKSLWRNFLAETEHIVSRAIAAQRKVATARCKRIANKNFSCFAEDEIWRGVENNVKSGPIPSFGKTLSSLFDTYLSKYDVEAAYFIEDVRSAKHKELEEKLHQHVRPAYKSMLGHIRSRVLDEFKVKFEEILKGTDDISVAIEDCVQSSVNRFKQECEDAGIELTHCDAIEAKHKLKDGVSAHVINGLTKHRATFAAANNNGRNDEASSGYWVDGITSFLQLLNTIVTIIATIFGGA